MVDEINIEDILFLDPDTCILKEGIEEYREKHERGEEIEPIGIFHIENGKYYARGGRHRTYFFFNELHRKAIPYELLTDLGLSDWDRERLRKGEVVSVHDLEVISWDDYQEE